MDIRSKQRGRVRRLRGSRNSSRLFFNVAIAFELSLGALALLPAVLLRIPPSGMFIISAEAIAGGILATVPLLLLFRLSLESEWTPLRRIRNLLSRLLNPLLQQLTVLRALLLGLAAGIGEELLFRGLIQAGLTPLIGPLPALLTASIAFGALHWLTSAYAVVATLLGVYLGALMLITESLIAPVLTHALYDAAALLLLARRGRAATDGNTPTPLA